MNPYGASQSNIEQGSLLLEIATRIVITLAPGDSVGTAAAVMTEKRISSLLIADADGHPVGIVTERNMLQAMQTGCSLQTALRDVMSSPVVTVPQSISTVDAYFYCLRNGIRHLVIVDRDGLLVGVVSETDFRLHLNLAALAGRRKVTSIARSSSLALSPATGLMQALELMHTQRKSCVIAVEDEMPVGIVTDRDVVRFYSGDRDYAGVTLGEVMVSPVLTLSHDATISMAAEAMLANKVRHLIVVNETGRMAGLLSEHDLTQTMIGGQADARDGLEENFLRTLINALPDLVWLKNVDGVYLACNPRFERFFGAKEQDIIGKTDYDFMPHEVAEFFRGYDRKAMESGTSSINEEWITYADDGHRELVETIKTPMRDSHGRLIGVLGIARDITERAATEESLRKLSAAVEQSATSVVITDLDARIQYVNPHFSVNTGYSATEAIGQNPRILQSGLMDRETYREMWGKLTSGQEWNGELLNRRKNGELYWEDVSIAPIKNSEGLATHYVAVKTEITERKQMEAALAASEHRYRMLIENAPFCIHEIDLQGRLQSMNHAGLDMMGLDDEQRICGVPYMSAVSERDGGRIEALLQDAFDGRPSHFEFAAAGDTSLSFKSCFIPIKDADGKVTKLMGITEDITERKRLEQQLLEREELFRAIFEQAPNGVELIDPVTLRFIEVNPAACRMLGYTHDEYLRLRLADTQADLNDQALVASVRQLELTGGATFENRHRCKNGNILDVEVTARPLDMPGKRLLIGVWRDITERKRAEENLRVIASVFDTSQEAIIITDADNIVTDVNPAFTLITGYSRMDVMGRNPRLLSSGRHDAEFYAAMWQALARDKVWRGEIWNRRKTGEIYVELLSISVICDDAGRVQRHVGVFSDISYLKEHEAALSRIAHYDALTGIPNRMLLADRMKQAIAQTSREQSMLAVCYLDLDGFKQVNDTLGHEAGDQVLIEMSKRLFDTVRGGDTVARLGGDEFVVLLLGLERGEECMATLARLHAAISRPILVKGSEITLGASIGVSIYPLDDEAPDTLLRHADQAMYVAKQSGKNRFYIYDAVLDQRARQRNDFLQGVRNGLQLGQFELYYQPKINLVTRELVGVEALIRWNHPERGLLVPAEFLRSIENSELDVELGDWVIATALTHIDFWQRAGLDIEVSINISAHHLESSGFPEKLQQMLAHYSDMLPGKLQIEVLETVALNDIAIVREIIEACRKFGVRFALDDFGTGYSSLSYLSKLPIDVLKIDQSFVRDMLEDKGDKAIIQGIIALAKAFDRETVAEGIETAEHYAALVEMGGEVGQGYGIARPMPMDELIRWQAARSKG